jgi:phosphoglucomutase
MSHQTITTTAFKDQQPGTSGLRKRVKVFKQPNYTANFVQAILESIPTGSKGATLVVGGDGRYYSKEAIHIIVELSAGNGVSKLIIGKDGILSTPAASNLIRKRKATGGILLTASHNQGGPEFDFGIKYNMGNGGPAPESVTGKIFQVSKSLTEYKKHKIPQFSLSTIGVQKFGELTVEIIDPVVDYVLLMKEIFDFEAIKHFIKSNPKFTVLFDGMNAVTGPYAKSIFLDELNLPSSSLINCTPKEDFGGGQYFKTNLVLTQI